MGKIGASDKLDKALVSKYANIKTVLKENYQNKKRKNSKNYYKKDVSVCEDKYKTFHKSFLKDIESRMEKYKKLKKHPLLNSKKLKKLEEEIKKYNNQNSCYEYYGIDIITLFIGQDLVNIADTAKENLLIPKIAQLRVKLVSNLGYCIPKIRVLDSINILPKGYKIEIRGRNVFENVLTSKNITDKEIQTIINDLERICIKYVRKIMSKKDVIKLMELVISDNPTLVNDLVPIFLSPIDLKHIFANLIEQKISIKDILYVFELLNDYARYTNDTDILTEKLKQELLFE